MKKNRLIYLPLGGAGEIGMNAYVYGYGPEDRERLIVVDLGVTFPDMDTTPGVDLIMPDISWLRRAPTGSRRSSSPTRMKITSVRWGICGRGCKAPIYARRFTAAIARMNFEEHGLADDPRAGRRPAPR
jgi:ribonuclease J